MQLLDGLVLVPGHAEDLLPVPQPAVVVELHLPLVLPELAALHDLPVAVVLDFWHLRVVLVEPELQHSLQLCHVPGPETPRNRLQQPLVHDCPVP